VERRAGKVTMESIIGTLRKWQTGCKINATEETSNRAVKCFNAATEGEIRDALTQIATGRDVLRLREVR
jgi:hypothetical protein